MEPSEVVQILNEAKWKNLRNWRKHPTMGDAICAGGTFTPLVLTLDDAIAIASYLRLTRPGGELERLRRLINQSKDIWWACSAESRASFEHWCQLRDAVLGHPQGE